MTSQVNNLCVRLLYVAAAGVVLAQVIGFNALVSPLFSLAVVLVVPLWLSLMANGLSRLDYLILAIMLTSFAGVSFDALATNAILSIGYFKKIILFFVSLVFLRSAAELELDLKTKRFIAGCTFAVIVVLVFFYFADSDRMHIYQGFHVGYLLFCFSNPNLAALFLTCFYMLAALFLLFETGPVKKIAFGFIAFFLLRFIVETESRNALIVAVAFSLSFPFLLLSRRRSFVFGKSLALFFSVYPLLFFILYVISVDGAVFKSVFEFLIDDGKQLDSRLPVWMPALQEYFSSPLIGSYNQISDGTGASQMHNTHFDILASYGPASLILSCVFLYMVVRSNGDRSYDRRGYMYNLAFCAALMLGAGEAALFSGGLVFYAYVGLFLLFRNGEKVGQ